MSTDITDAWIRNIREMIKPPVEIGLEAVLYDRDSRFVKRMMIPSAEKFIWIPAGIYSRPFRHVTTWNNRTALYREISPQLNDPYTYSTMFHGSFSTSREDTNLTFDKINESVKKLKQEEVRLPMVKVEVIREELKEPPIKEVVIRMDLETAEVLATVLSNVAGEPDGPRGRIDQIEVALRNSGVGDKLADGYRLSGGIDLCKNDRRPYYK